LALSDQNTKYPQFKDFLTQSKELREQAKKLAPQMPDPANPNNLPAISENLKNLFNSSADASQKQQITDFYEATKLFHSQN